jgi:hypothetical protein
MGPYYCLKSVGAAKKPMGGRNLSLQTHQEGSIKFWKPTGPGAQ